MEERISWEEYALLLARTAALRSEDVYWKVGACALNSQKMVLGLGYNGLASGKNVAAAFWKDRDERRKYMIHAEVNCLSLFKRDEAEILAVTTLPCSSCAAMIVSYGIKRVIYEEDYKRDDVALEIFKFYKIEFKKINIRNKRLT